MRRRFTNIFSISIPVLSFIFCWTGCNNQAIISGKTGHIEKHRINRTSFNLVYIKKNPRPFIYGEHVEQYQREVKIEQNYWLAETEVTQGLWEEVMSELYKNRDGDSTGKIRSQTDPHSTKYGSGKKYPAYYVNWFYAVAFCNALTDMDPQIGTNEIGADKEWCTGDSIIYSKREIVYYNDRGAPYTFVDAANKVNPVADLSKTGYRLPTGVEWEYAARYLGEGKPLNHGNHASGDISGACFLDSEGFIDSLGHKHKPRTCSHPEISPNMGKYIWFLDNSGSKGGLKPVAKKEPNYLGLYDMSGNVWEWTGDWCWDWGGDYEMAYGENEEFPQGAETGQNRVIRGGSRMNRGEDLSSAHRFEVYPITANYSTGFRLCRTAE